MVPHQQLPLEWASRALVLTKARRGFARTLFYGQKVDRTRQHELMRDMDLIGKKCIPAFVNSPSQLAECYFQLAMASMNLDKPADCLQYANLAMQTVLDKCFLGIEKTFYVDRFEFLY